MIDMTPPPQAPTVTDVAIGLSTIPRFNGRTIVPWTVLQHVLAGVTLVPESDPIARMEWLFHDAEEIWTGDIPKPFKVPEQKAYADELRRFIFKETISFPYPEDTSEGALDQAMCNAEAEVLIHPRDRHLFEQSTNFKAVDAVWAYLGMEAREGIYTFTTTVEQLLADHKVKIMQERV